MSDTKRLAQLLDQKHDVLIQLHALATRQLDVASASDTGVMFSLIATKQKLIDALMQLEQLLAPFRAESPEERVWDSPEERVRTAGVSQQCDVLLQEIMSMDRLGLERVQSRQQQTRVQIDAAQQAASARNAYLASQTPGPHTIDVASEA